MSTPPAWRPAAATSSLPARRSEKAAPAPLEQQASASPCAPDRADRRDRAPARAPAPAMVSLPIEAMRRGDRPRASPARRRRPRVGTVSCGCETHADAPRPAPAAASRPSTARSPAPAPPTRICTGDIITLRSSAQAASRLAHHGVDRVPLLDQRLPGGRDLAVARVHHRARPPPELANLAAHRGSLPV